MTETEIIDLMKEWKEETRKYATDYSEAISKLAAVEKSLEKEKEDYKKLQNRFWIKYFLPVIISIVMFFLVIATANAFNLCEIKYEIPFNIEIVYCQE